MAGVRCEVVATQWRLSERYRSGAAGKFEENGGAEAEKKALSGADQDHG